MFYKMFSSSKVGNNNASKYRTESLGAKVVTERGNAIYNNFRIRLQAQDVYEVIAHEGKVRTEIKTDLIILVESDIRYKIFYKTIQ